MNTFSFTQFLLLCICFLAIQQGSTGCEQPTLDPGNNLVITIFDSHFQVGDTEWSNLCQAVKQFPKGRVTLDYRPGALAKFGGGHMSCGGASADCKQDTAQACAILHSKNYNDCYKPIETDVPKMKQCNTSGEANKLLLDNAKLRENLKIPANAIPAYAMNGKYDPCAKFKSYQDVLNYLCKVYQGKC